MNTEYTVLAYSRNTVSAVPTNFVRSDYMPMGYLDQLADLRKRKKLTQVDMAERMKVEQSTYQRWEKGKREPSFEQLFKLADILGVPPGSLLDAHIAAPMGPRLYVKGEVAAGVWKSAVELPQDEWQTFTGRADVTADSDHRFGLRIVGDSMDLVYPPGTIVECVSIFGRAAVVPGKRVVVVRQNSDNEYEATVKELVEQDGELWLVPRSRNPAHRPIKLDAPDPDIIETRIAAVVVSSVRPE